MKNSTAILITFSLMVIINGFLLDKPKDLYTLCTCIFVCTFWIVKTLEEK
jgi:hypothetical protein